MTNDSILAQTFLHQVLLVAERNLEKDGVLFPVLFLRFGQGVPNVIILKLGHTTEEKLAEMALLGESLRRAGKSILEALMLCEVWFVKSPKDAEALTIPPSEHPDRKEAIVLFGRDQTGERASMVVQPFVRDVANKPLWDSERLEEFNQGPNRRYHFVGLLDQLFISN